MNDLPRLSVLRRWWWKRRGFKIDHRFESPWGINCDGSWLFRDVEGTLPELPPGKPRDWPPRLRLAIDSFVRFGRLC